MRLNLAQALICRSDCCCSTNRLTTSISMPLSGWKMAEELSGHADPDLSRPRLPHPIVDKIIHIEQQSMFEYTGTTVRLKFSAPPVWRSSKRCTKPAGTRGASAKLYRPFPCQTTKAKQAQSRIKMLERMELIPRRTLTTRFVLASARRKACLSVIKDGKSQRRLW